MKQVLIGAGCFLFIACLWPTLRVSPPQAALPLPTTAQQILDKSEPLCDALAPAGVSLQLAAQLTPGTEAVRPIWNVECTDRYGHDLVNLRWSVDTGRLLSAGTQYALFKGTTIRLATAPQMREAVRSWLKTLGLSSDTSSWRIDRSKYRPATTTWIVQCVSSRQRVLLNLDARSGMLRYLLTDGYLTVRLPR